MRQDKTVAAVLTTCLTEDHLRQLSTTAALEPAVLQRALPQLTALVLVSLRGRAERLNGPETIWALTQQAQENALLAHLPALNTPQWRGRGVLLMQGLLGDAYERTLHRLVATTSLPEATLTLLIEVAVADVLSGAATYAADHTLDAAGLAQWLQSQPLPAAQAPAPPGHQPDRPVPTPGGLPRPATSAAGESQRFTVAGAGTWERIGGGITFTPEQSGASSPWKRWKWALLLLPAVVIGYLVGKSLLGPDASGGPAAPPAGAATVSPAPATSAPAVSGRYDAATDTYIYDIGQPVIITLPDGSTQRVGTNSTEYRLYRFLIDPTQRVDTLNQTKNWINLDRTYFESGKATLAPESEQQLRHLAGILKAFPRAQVRFGGYSDSTGDALQNLYLSEARASTAMRTLIGLGVADNRLQAQGYGASYFVASNAAPIGRALNRRLSLQVVSKSGAPLPPVAAEEVPAAQVAPATPDRPAKAVRTRTGRPASARARPKPAAKVGQWFKRLGQRLRKDG